MPLISSSISFITFFLLCLQKRGAYDALCHAMSWRSDENNTTLTFFSHPSSSGALFWNASSLTVLFSHLFSPRLCFLRRCVLPIACCGKEVVVFEPFYAPAFNGDQAIHAATGGALWNVRSPLLSHVFFSFLPLCFHDALASGFHFFFRLFSSSGELLGTATKKIGGHCCWWQGLGLPFVSVCVAFTGCAPNHGITFCFAPPPPAAAAATVAVCVLKIKVCTTKVIPIHRRRCCSPEGGCVTACFSQSSLYVLLWWVSFRPLSPTTHCILQAPLSFPLLCLTMHCLTIVLIWKLFIKHAAGCARLFPLHILFFWYKPEKKKKLVAI